MPVKTPYLVSVTRPCALPSALRTTLPTKPSVTEKLATSSGSGFEYVNVVLEGVLITVVFSSNVSLSSQVTLIWFPI